MKINIVARNTTAQEKFRERCASKLRKLDKFFSDDANATVTLSNQNGNETVEVMIASGGMFFRAEKTTSDRMDSLEAVTDALFKQITRNKAKLERKFKSGKFETPAEIAEEREGDYGIARTKKFRVSQMDAQEAILQMNMLGHSFFMFRNPESGEINVVYKRFGGDYGVLEPID